MLTRTGLLIIIVWFFAAATGANAQPNGGALPTVVDLGPAPPSTGVGYDDIPTGAPPVAVGPGPVPASTGVGYDDVSTEPRRESALSELLAERTLEEWAAYRRFSFQHARRVYWSQFVTSWIVFAVSVAVLCFGLYASWRYFKKEDGPRETRIERKEGAAEQVREAMVPPAVHELEVTTSGVKLSSRAVGLIVLGLSLAFFYLYLKFVYPITNLQNVDLPHVPAEPR